MDVALVGMIVTVAVQIVGVGIFVGITTTKINYLEKKMDKHNGLVERMVVVEQSCKSIHHRVDDLNDK